MIDINKYLDSLKPSATLAINQEVQLLKSENIDIVHFGFGQSPFPIYKGIVKALQNHADHNEYLPTLGLTALRQQISLFLKQHQGIEMDWSHIFIGPGSKELLYHTILILEGEFLIPKGSWVSYLPQIKTKGGSCTILDTEYANDFKLNAETLERHCENSSGKQKVLILNSPNNPTGAVYNNEELQSIAKVCMKHGIIVLSDEIYSQINFGERYSASISQYYPQGTIVYGGLSKVFSAGGYRLGYVAIPEAMKGLRATFKALFSETFSAVAAPIQYAAIEAYKMNDGLLDYISRCKNILGTIAGFVFQELKKLNIECTQPQGAFYVMIGFSHYKEQINALGIHSSEALAHHLIQSYHLALLPGTDFYFSSSDLFLRLAYVDFDGKSLLEKFLHKTEINSDHIIDNCPNITKGIGQLRAFITTISA
ncbi:MAG: aminotransferase class I/II-fold pyridoxal phosphate-dependent enzyme [Bacteroidia bacterium]|nr:aminotransferase class I/II-fold pyridoxal phosphate-dependent enzyme [Bacteroidia bacterium]